MFVYVHSLSLKLGTIQSQGEVTSVIDLCWRYSTIQVFVTLFHQSTTGNNQHANFGQSNLHDLRMNMKNHHISCIIGTNLNYIFRTYSFGLRTSNNMLI